ncbi:MAG: hypothetical protein U0T56_03985 [Ferruginibacter sp.]
MPVLFYRKRLFIALLCSAILLFASSCKKVKEDLTVNILEQYFEQNILNRDFRVYLATNLGTDITSTYDGYLFRLLKNTNYDGPMTASKNGTVLYTGTWSTNEDFGKLVITLNTPSVPAEFVFLNRQWRFTEKGIPIMKLAPWGSSADIVLHMERL